MNLPKAMALAREVLGDHRPSASERECIQCSSGCDDPVTWPCDAVRLARALLEE